MASAPLPSTGYSSRGRKPRWSSTSTGSSRTYIDNARIAWRQDFDTRHFPKQFPRKFRFPPNEDREEVEKEMMQIIIGSRRMVNKEATASGGRFKGMPVTVYCLDEEVA